MFSVSDCQRIPSLEALALQAWISAQRSQSEPMEVEGEKPLNSVSRLALIHWERLKNCTPHGPLGILNAMRVIEHKAKNPEHSGSESFDKQIKAPCFSNSQPFPKDCKVTELFRQLAKQLNDELQKNGRSLQAEVLIAPEQFVAIQASLQQEAEQWTLKYLCNEIRRRQELSEATSEEFQNWVVNLAHETPDITNLSLNHPRIQALPDEISHFQRLQKFSIGADLKTFGSLRYLPESIHTLTNLTYLNVSYNELEELPQSFHCLTNLQELHLEGNHLKSLSESFGDLTNLTYLNLKSNLLEWLPESIGNLTNLGNDPRLEGQARDLDWYDLRLNNNYLKKLPESFGKLIHLHILDLSNNELKELPLSFGKLQNLIKVEINFNYLATLPSTFRNLSDLLVLSLDSNKFKIFPQEIRALTDLETLDIGHNELEQLPEAFADLHNLTSLDLSYNKFKHIPNSIGRLSSFECLNIQHNKLSRLPSWIFQLRHLEWIDLHHNRITMLPSELEYTGNFSIADNPLLLISDAELNTNKSFKELQLIQSENLYSYRPSTSFSSLLQALAREDIPAIGALFNTLDPNVKDRILSRYQTLEALENQELNLSSSSSQAEVPIDSFKYPNLLGQACREEIYHLSENKIEELAVSQSTPIKERIAQVFGSNLLYLADMILINQDLKRKATNSNPPFAPFIKRQKKEE